MRFVGDSIERFEDGDLVFLGRDLPHYWWKDADDRRRAHSMVVQFRADFDAGTLFGLPEAAELRRFILLARRGLVFSGQVRDRVAADLLCVKTLSTWERRCLLLKILGRLATGEKPRLLASASFSPEVGERDGRRLTAVCQYVNEFYAELMNHQKAATMAGLSPAAFSRFFHQRMGKTFEGYVTEIRIGHACRRLMEDDARVVEIAFASGFNNLSNFNRHFLKLKGLTPRAYRKLAGSGACLLPF